MTVNGTLDYARPGGRKRCRAWRWLCGAAIASVAYFYPYYGWMRTTDEEGTYSLRYDQLPKPCADVLSAIHAPLRAIDQRRLIRLYHLKQPAIPDFADAPDFGVRPPRRP